MEFFEKEETSKVLAEDWITNSPSKLDIESPNKRVTFVTDIS